MLTPRITPRIYRAAIIFAVGILGLFLASLAQGAGSFPLPGNISSLPTAVTQSKDVENILCGIVVWIFWGLVVFSVAMFLVGGYFYATAGGEPERVSRANKTLLYATIAVAVAIVAAGIPYLIGSFFGASILGHFCTVF